MIPIGEGITAPGVIMGQPLMGSPCTVPIRLEQERQGPTFFSVRHRDRVGVPVGEELVLEEEVQDLGNSKKREK